MNCPKWISKIKPVFWKVFSHVKCCSQFSEFFQWAFHYCWSPIQKKNCSLRRSSHKNCYSNFSISNYHRPKALQAIKSSFAIHRFDSQGIQPVPTWEMPQEQLAWLSHGIFAAIDLHRLGCSQTHRSVILVSDRASSRVHSHPKVCIPHSKRQTKDNATSKWWIVLSRCLFLA